VIDVLEIALINIISLNKFSDGGAAIFADSNKNHHIDNVGQIDSMPFVKYMLRVCVIVYDRFAIINNADEHNPWAIIIISAADILQEE